MKEMEIFEAHFKDGSYLRGECEKFRQDETRYILNRKGSETFIAKSEVKYLIFGATCESDDDNLCKGV